MLTTDPVGRRPTKEAKKALITLIIRLYGYDRYLASVMGRFGSKGINFYFGCPCLGARCCHVIDRKLGQTPPSVAVDPREGNLPHLILQTNPKRVQKLGLQYLCSLHS